MKAWYALLGSPDEQDPTNEIECVLASERQKKMSLQIQNISEAQDMLSLIIYNSETICFAT